MSDAAPMVAVVDDDAAVRKSLARLLRSAHYDVTAFGSPQEFLERQDTREPACLVLDVAMPGLNGLELQKVLAARRSAMPIVFLTGRGDIPTSVAAMKLGAVDFLTKPIKDVELMQAVEVAIERGGAARQARAEVDDIGARLATLTPREHQVLESVVAGRLNKQIAADLGTVEQTIKVHRARVMAKMRATSLADLVRLAGRARSGAD